jgi:hypothetical protein
MGYDTFMKSEPSPSSTPKPHRYFAQYAEGFEGLAALEALDSPPTRQPGLSAQSAQSASISGSELLAYQGSRCYNG